MRYRQQYSAPLPRPVVFQVHRDHLPVFGPRLPGIAAIERVATDCSDDGRVRLEHHWIGDVSMIPAVLRRLIPEHLFTWIDRTDWDPETWTCTWRLDVPALGDGAHIDGTYAFDDGEAGTTVTVDATLSFDVDERSPLASSVLGRRMMPVVQTFVRGLFRTIMGRSTAVISRYLDEVSLQAAA